MRILLFFTLLCSLAAWLPAQSARDVVYLREGGTLSGRIQVLEQKPGAEIRLQLSGKTEIFLPAASVQRIFSEGAGSEFGLLSLQNGQTLRGRIEILEQIPGESVRLWLTGENVLLLQEQEVLRIVREVAEKKTANEAAERQEAPLKTKGYYNLTTLGLGFGGPSIYLYGTPAHLSAANINGWRFKRWMAAGLGAGMNVYVEGPVMPVFADFRGDLLDRKVSPHYYAQAGYGIPLFNRNITWDGWIEDYKARGGAMLSAGAGMRFHGRTGIDWLMTCGYQQQALSESIRYADGSTNLTNRVFRRVVFQAGLMF